MITFLRKAFFSGSLVLLPLGITIFVINFLLVNFGEPVGAVLIEFFKINIPDKLFFNLLVNVFSLFVVFAILTLIGLLSRYFVGRWFINLSERIIVKVPFINAVYNTVKQVVDTFSKNNKAVFQKVVLVEYPRKGCFGVGFLTGEARGEVGEKIGENFLNVFIPTTPNPTSGFLILFPEDEVKILDMAVADGMKFIISGGAVVPENLRNQTSEDKNFAEVAK